jgi:hypothetical protein
MSDNVSWNKEIEHDEIVILNVRKRCYYCEMQIATKKSSEWDKRGS